MIRWIWSPNLLTSKGPPETVQAPLLAAVCPSQCNPCDGSSQPARSWPAVAAARWSCIWKWRRALEGTGLVELPLHIWIWYDIIYIIYTYHLNVKYVYLLRWGSSAALVWIYVMTLIFGLKSACAFFVWHIFRTSTKMAVGVTAWFDPLGLFEQKKCLHHLRAWDLSSPSLTCTTLIQFYAAGRSQGLAWRASWQRLTSFWRLQWWDLKDGGIISLQLWIPWLQCP